jgi:hypothetical protein
MPGNLTSYAFAEKEIGPDSGGTAIGDQAGG